MKALQAAKKAARKAIESTYSGQCTIKERRDIKDEKTKISRKSEISVVEDQPCRLSFEKIAAAVQTETAAAISQGIKLFLAPEITVKPGSKIVVTQAGVTGEYQLSGAAAVYETHQEIMLELFKGWA